MGNLSTTDYAEGAIGAWLVYYGFKKAGWEKWALVGVGAYLIYGVYEAY